MGRNRSSAHTKAQRAGRERDRNQCQVCGSKDHVEGHHIIATNGTLHSFFQKLLAEVPPLNM